jgi:tetratricopeptide (TPR) repeat protein
VARKARRARKQQPESATETLDEIESVGDRVVDWAGQNPYVILGTAAGILLIVGAVALTMEWRDSARVAGAGALASVQGEYREAMGASPAAVEIPEPANPETAKRVRGAYIEKFRAVAEEYDGSTAGALALLEAGALQQHLGENEAALATYREALDSVAKGDPMRPFLHLSIASVHEESAAWSEAAAAYRAAADVADFPLRWDALADAARCYRSAGDAAQALAAYEQLQTDAPDYRLAPYLAAQYAELRSAQAQP